LDGVNENIGFNCEQTTASATTTAIEATPAPSQSYVKEEVKCLFTGSNSGQRCYSEVSACSGVGTCVASVYWEKGKMLTWKSSCGGLAYTLTDGNNEYAEFNCVQAAAQIQAVPIQQPVNIEMPAQPRPTYIESPAIVPSEKKVKLYIFEWPDCPACKSERAFLDGLKQQYPPVVFDTYNVTPESGMTYPVAIASYLKEGHPTTFLHDKIWTGFDDSRAAEIEAMVKYCIEQGGCLSGGEASAATPVATADYLKEQIECIFWNSDVLANPHSARPEKCYTDDGRFGCAWTGEVVEKEADNARVRYAYCIADVSGPIGTRLNWKSSCGGYAYTVIDGNNEAAEFKCVPSLEVREEQIVGKGFRRAYWQCYDGLEYKTAVSVSLSCKTSELWQREAEEFCKNHCYKDGSKCGVNSFSVSEECYPEFGMSDVLPIPAMPVEEEGVKQEEGRQAEEGGEKKEEAVLICKDSCPLNGRCYPFGYRKAGNFCSDEGGFIPQLEANKPCDNNFECSSNICIDGSCMSSGLIKRIINLFRRWVE